MLSLATENPPYIQSKKMGRTRTCTRNFFTSILRSPWHDGPTEQAPCPKGMSYLWKSSGQSELLARTVSQPLHFSLS